MYHFASEASGFQVSVGSRVTPDYGYSGFAALQSHVVRQPVSKARVEVTVKGRRDLRSPEVLETESPQSALALEYRVIRGGLGDSVRFVKPHCDAKFDASPVRSYVGRDTRRRSPRSVVALEYRAIGADLKASIPTALPHGSAECGVMTYAREVGRNS